MTYSKTWQRPFQTCSPCDSCGRPLTCCTLSDLPIGSDGRTRCLMSPFGTITGRCTPSTTRFIFGRPAWMRSLIKPEQGRALAYIDWSSQEYGIGAVLSGDSAMLADYRDWRALPLAFAKRTGTWFLPHATKTHRTGKPSTRTSSRPSSWVRNMAWASRRWPCASTSPSSTPATCFERIERPTASSGSGATAP